MSSFSSCTGAMLTPDQASIPVPLLHRTCLSFPIWISRSMMFSPPAGAEIKMAHGQEDRNPVVLGRIGRDPSKPTVCFYGARLISPSPFGLLRCSHLSSRSFERLQPPTSIC